MHSALGRALFIIRRRICQEREKRKRAKKQGDIAK